jgi:hypothetical protein
VGWVLGPGRHRVGTLDADQGRQERRLPDGRSFQTIKRYWQPSQLAADLARLGWQAAVRNTHWAFVYGSLARAVDATSAGAGQHQLVDG